VTEAAIEKRLWYSLSLSTIKWRKGTKHEYASVDSWNAHHTIWLPPDQDDDYTLRYLVHELAHVSISSELGAFDCFEEPILERVVEPRMIDYFMRRRYKHAKWLRALREARTKEGS
jgi:hypothetical protein